MSITLYLKHLKKFLEEKFKAVEERSPGRWRSAHAFSIGNFSITAAKMSK
ncbi:MAG: hypothetical protein RMY34_31730 [Aulosira sp. DedQUE10]|nr:hypothetical protein [Aulosira sp. DedQUE10]